MKIRGYVFPMLTGLVAFLVYLAGAWFILPPEAVWSPDAGAKFLQLQSLRWENGRLAYDISYPGRRLDPTLQFASSDPTRGLLVVLNGKLQFQRLPMFPLLANPLFQGVGVRGLYLLPALGGAVSGVLALSLLRECDRRFAMWVLIAFASPIYIYAMLFWEHTLAVSLGLAGAWLAFCLEPLDADKSPLYRTVAWAAVGGLLGISVYIRLEMVIFALALLLAYGAVVSENRGGILGAGVTLGLVMLPYRPLHGLLFSGQKVAGNAAYLFYPFVYLSNAGWRVVPDLLVGPFAHGAIDTGWLGVVWAGAAVVVIVQSWVVKDSLMKRWVHRVGLFVIVIIGAIFLFTPRAYRSAHGLLFTTPWALLGLSRARDVWQQGDWRARVVVLMTWVGVLGYTGGIVILRGSSPHGGLEWGARFAMAFYPLLALIAAWDLGDQRDDVIMRTVVAALLLLGLGFQIRGVYVIRHDKQISLALNQGLIRMPEPYVVSDLSWIPLNAAFIYNRKQIFVTDTSEELSEWVTLAARQQVERFIVVTLDSALLTHANRRLEGRRLEMIDMWRLGNLKILQVSLLSP